MSSRKTDNNDFSVKIAPNCVEKFDISIITYSEDYFRFNFANVNIDEKIVNVDKIAMVPVEFMKTFLDELIESLINYEKEYKNGNGLDLSK